jgi:hypothetical protein
MSKRVRITEDFVRTFCAVKGHLRGTYNSDAFAAKLQADANLRSLVDHLDTLVSAILNALKKKKDKTIKQAHHEFAERFDDFRTRWKEMLSDYLFWRV